MLRIVIDADNPEPDKLAQAGEIIRRGGLVAFPTETVYGLGADALNEEAVARIYKVKGRPSDNPLIRHANRAEDFYKHVIFCDTAHRLADTFWPGSLTLVLNKADGTGTLAVRVPQHNIARGLIEASGCIIAAPSANLSGRPSPTKAEHVAEDFPNGEIDMLIDGGAASKGLESTVVDLHTHVPRLLRPGAVSLEMLKDAIGEIDCPTQDMSGEAPLSPGMKYRHYAPKAPLTLLIGTPDAVSDAVKNHAGNTGVIRTHNIEAETTARTLFDKLRQFDRDGVSRIIVEGVSEAGIGLAIMNRLKKAAAEVIYL